MGDGQRIFFPGGGKEHIFGIAPFVNILSVNLFVKMVFDLFWKGRGADSPWPRGWGSSINVYAQKVLLL